MAVLSILLGPDGSQSRWAAGHYGAWKWGSQQKGHIILSEVASQTDTEEVYLVL